MTLKISWELMDPVLWRRRDTYVGIAYRCPNTGYLQGGVKKWNMYLLKKN